MKIKIFGVEINTFNYQALSVKTLTNFTFYFLLFTLFFQTRFAFFARYQTVDYLIPFVYFSDVLIVLLLLSTLIWQRGKLLKFLRLFRNRRWTFQFFSFSVFLFFTAISNFSAIHSVSAWYHWFKILELGLFAFWVGWFVGGCHSDPPVGGEESRWNAVISGTPHFVWDDKRTILNFLSLGLALQCLIAISEFVFQRSLGLQIFGEWRFSILTPGIAKVVLFGKEFLRPYATFPHPNVLGGILAIMAPVNFYLATAENTETCPPTASPSGEGRRESAETQRKLSVSANSPACPQRSRLRGGRALQRLQGYYLLIFLLFTFTLFLTFSRSAWLAYVVLMVVVLVFWRRREIRERRRRGLAIGKGKSFFFLLFTFYFLLLTPPFVYQRIKSLQTTDVLSIERRVELNSAAISMFWDHPLFGVGLGNFVPNLEKYLIVSGQGRFLQPVHNVPLLILAETGIVGSVTFSLFFGTLLYNFLRSRSTKSKISSFKQIPNSKFKIQNIFSFDFWCLRFGAYLELGAWNLVLIIMWLGILIISLFDHYWWTLQAGQLFFWLTVGLTI